MGTDLLVAVLETVLETVVDRVLNPLPTKWPHGAKGRQCFSTPFGRAFAWSSVRFGRCPTVLKGLTYKINWVGFGLRDMQPGQNTNHPYREEEVFDNDDLVSEAAGRFTLVCLRTVIGTISTSWIHSMIK